MKANRIVDGNINPVAEIVNRTIYVDASGNDITGDGGVALPYATVGKALSTILKQINSGVTITISIGIGTFNIHDEDLSILNVLIGSGILTLQGTLVLVESGFTMGASQALDPLTYDVSGGNTATWTLDQWKYYFLKSGSNYFPITHNDLTPSLSTVGAVTGTEIYQAQTILNFTAAVNQDIKTNISRINFSNCQLTINASITINFLGVSDIVLASCIVNGNGTTTLEFNVYSEYGFTKCAYNNTRVLVDCQNKTTCQYNYFYLNANSPCLTVLHEANIGSFYDEVFENPNTGSLACGVATVQGTLGVSPGTRYLKFINCNIGYRFGKDSYAYYVVCKIIIKNTAYLFRKYVAAQPDDERYKIEFNFTNFLGVPTTRYFYDAMTSFVIVGENSIFKVSNLIYPEFEQNLSAKLLNNTTNNIIIGDKLQNKSLSIDYTINRGVGLRKGKIDFIYDGSTLYQSPDSFIFNNNSIIDASAIVFNSDVSNNYIRLNAQLNTGSDASLFYNIERVMITPLTI
jgi:hypothetical protein